MGHDGFWLRLCRPSRLASEDQIPEQENAAFSRAAAGVKRLSLRSRFRENLGISNRKGGPIRQGHAARLTAEGAYAWSSIQTGAAKYQS